MTDTHPGVLVDVDGTLIDSNYLHTLAWSRAFRDIGEWAPMNAIHRLVGMGGDMLTERLLGRKDDKADQGWARHYEALKDEVRVFPRAADLLRGLRDAGLQVVLATSSPKEDLEFARGLLSADDAIDASTTKDDVDQSKPAPDIFTTAMKAGSVDPDRAVALGDSVWDVEAAQAAGIRCVGLETGGFSEHELREAGAVAVYRDASDALDHLADWVPDA